VGINQSTSKKDTLGQDPWCGKTGPGIAFKRGFTQPESWGNYECMDVFLESEEEKEKVKEFCKTGSEYAIEKINQCPGAQLCCDFTKVPAGYGWYCLLEKEKDDTKELKCEKIGFGFKTETECISKYNNNNEKYYETESDCNKAIAEANKPKKNKDETCTKTEECNTELVCRHVLENGGNVSKEKQCQSKLASGKGPCVNFENDCRIGEYPYACRTANEKEVNYKICSIPKIDGGRCLEASDCAQGWECKDEKCTRMKCVIGDNSTCPIDQYCSNGNVLSQTIYKPECYEGKKDDPCENNNNCRSGVCKKAIAGQQDKCE